MHQTTPQSARPHPSAKAIKLAHLIFHRPDPDPAKTFLRDFGLTVVDRSHEQTLARAADESSYCYRVHRTQEERLVGLEAVWSQATVVPLPDRAPMTLNVGGRRPRINADQWPAMEPLRIVEHYADATSRPPISRTLVTPPAWPTSSSARPISASRTR